MRWLKIGLVLVVVILLLVAKRLQDSSARAKRLQDSSASWTDHVRSAFLSPDKNRLVINDYNIIEDCWPIKEGDQVGVVFDREKLTIRARRIVSKPIFLNAHLETEKSQPIELFSVVIDFDENKAIPKKYRGSDIKKITREGGANDRR